MPTPTLATKLYIPPLRLKMVLRPRLITRLNAGLAAGHKLTLISAPAGFGKTTVVSEWVNSCARPVAWLSLDTGDNDPARFLTYLVAALQTMMPNLGAGLLALLQTPQPLQEPAACEALLTSLLNEIATIPDNPTCPGSPGAGRGFVLVLDDYHTIDAGGGIPSGMGVIDKALAFLIEHLPPQLHLVIATREDPQLPLARLRARDQLTEVRAADLRFTPTEAAEFLNQAMGLTLAAEEIAALETRTEGWIAGLQLAALSMQGLPDTTGFIKSFTGSNRFVLDYLLEEVLQQQPARIQTFLLRTSILNRMCGALCDAVLLDPAVSGQEILETLERANLFTVPLDQERRWYRYHHLFGDLLRQRLGSAADLPELHLRASRWYEENGDLAASFQHALAAVDFERAAHLAEMAWQEMDRTFQTAAWLGWVNNLPMGLVSARPRLCMQLGWAFSDAGALETSETHLQNAERALAGMTDQAEAKSLPGIIALIRACNAQIEGNLAATAQYAELSLQLIPADDLYHRAQAIITLEFTHWATGELEAAHRAMHIWMSDMQRLGNQLFAIASAFAVADMQVTLGHLAAAETTLRQAIQQAAAQGQEAESVTAHHHLGLALLAHERGDDRAMSQHLQAAADLGQRTTLVDWLYRWHLAQARFKEAAGDWAAALEWFDKAEQSYVKNPIPILQSVAAHKVRIYLKQGRLDKAQAWVQERPLTTEDEVCYLNEYDHLTLARVRLATASCAGVSALLARLLTLAARQKRTGSVLEILLTQALVEQAQGNQPQALAALEQALTLAVPEGYLRIFVDEGEPLRVLLWAFRGLTEKQAPDRVHPQRGYVDKLLAAFAPPAGLPPATTSNLPLAIVEPLTPRELDVLRLIAQGLSNHEIGERLFLALDTIKGYNRRIFDKLQVQRRTEAIARARALGLL